MVFRRRGNSVRPNILSVCDSKFPIQDCGKLVEHNGPVFHIFADGKRG